MQENAGANLNEKGKRWVGTLNNPRDNWQEIFTNNELTDLVAYYVCGKEYAPSTGTPHVHFYIRFKTQQYRSTLRRLLPECWFELAKGSEYDAIKYTTKNDKSLEFGTPIQTANNLLQKEERLKEMLKDVTTMDWSDFETKWAPQAFYHRRKLLEYKIEHMKPMDIWAGDLKMKNIWISGAPGVGKSYWARTRLNPENIYPKNVNKWWDGFVVERHKLVIIEDFPLEGSIFNQHMKVWADRYSFIGETKGGQMRIDPGRFFLVITSNYDLEEVFKGPDSEAIKRRFSTWKIESREDVRLQSDLDTSLLSNN